MLRLGYAILLCGCWSAPVAQKSVVVAPAPPVEEEVELPEPAALHDAWIAAVATRDPVRIASLLEPPFRVYLDDGTTGRTRPACERWRRTTVEITSKRERDELARCIAATVHHSDPPPSLFGGDPTGVVAHDLLQHHVDEPVRDELVPLAEDHVFVHGGGLASGDYDFTLAVRRGGRIGFLGLTSHPGC
jgi:hypothetical protein